MPISVMCSKGCKTAINVDDDTLEEFAKLGKAIDVAHDVCPQDRIHKPEYRVALHVTRQDYDDDGNEQGDPVLLTTRGLGVHAATFEEAFPKLSNGIGGKWAEIAQWGEVMEQQQDSSQGT